jgi:hypothetical protein
MNPYSDLANELAALMGDALGGVRDERLATARLFQALVFCEMVKIAAALRATDVEAIAREDSGEIVLRVAGVHVRLQRLPGQVDVVLEFIGFDSRVVPHSGTSRRLSVRALPYDVIRRAAVEIAAKIDLLLRQEFAVR